MGFAKKKNRKNLHTSDANPHYSCFLFFSFSCQFLGNKYTISNQTYNLASYKNRAPDSPNLTRKQNIKGGFFQITKSAPSETHTKQKLAAFFFFLINKASCFMPTKTNQSKVSQGQEKYIYIYLYMYMNQIRSKHRRKEKPKDKKKTNGQYLFCIRNMCV